MDGLGPSPPWPGHPDDKNSLTPFQKVNVVFLQGHEAGPLELALLLLSEEQIDFYG